MIPQDFLKDLGMSPDSLQALQDALQKESIYRNILYKIGVFPSAIEKIMRTVDTSNLDTDNMELLTEKSRVEWTAFIERKDRK